jgi:CheY-like chemotaxis protein
VHDFNQPGRHPVRIRICRKPTRTIDGIYTKFLVGAEYDVGASVGSVLLSEGWGEPAEFQQPPAAAEPARERISVLVLVVDDDAGVRALTSDVLSTQGYEVVEARHGREALTSLVQHVPDVVILDLEMPVMNGWQFRAEQQGLADERLTSIPVVVVTAADDSAAHAAALHAAALVTKPFEPDRLLSAVRTALRR